MSDREFSGFDADAVKEAVRQPPLDDLYRVVARRRQRRSSGVALALVAVLGAVAGGPMIGSQVGGPDGSEEPSPVPGITQLFVLDETSAVGVRQTADCVVEFGYTDDLGVTWSEFRPLSYEQPCRGDAEGRHAADLRYQPLSVRTYLVSVDDRSYLSTDAGRTWREADSVITAVDSFPTSADPVNCQGGCFGLRQPLAVDPDNGAVFRLRGESPSPFPLHEMYETTDGALWTAYWPGDIDRPSVVARSVDRGATWQPATLPEPFTGDTPPSLVGLAAESAEVAYLLVNPRDGIGPYAMIFRTSDGGDTWTEVATDLPASQALRPFAVGAGRVLLVADADLADGYVWVSRDGGRHFVRGPAVEPGNIGGLPGLVWIADQDGASITSDGVTWQARLALPQ
ncbi:sialidase family protein [Polymorphospora sp. NPDC050346]|uniref:WD40/YVTN/BNR-like repeat-containing protein n=1 Tax=Polymorphospora sp. NPDC050346 TaxID=3155780 RepID=UPI0033D645F0